jgi:23S rRNA maturation mini-RNase III
LGIAIPLASVIYGILFYILCTRYQPKLEESFIRGLKPVAGTAPTKENRRTEKATYMLLNEMENVRLDYLQLSNRKEELERILMVVKQQDVS